ncbi:MAG: DUF4352 domain-containing protein [Acidobacteriota bacterium]|jgi:hypothetical protein|nr:DUF4352 domain-containing protein [Acidobacteriota bacterium]
MKRKIAAFPIILMVFVCAGMILPAWSQESSPTNPAAVGTPVKSMIELGSVSANIYDITITNLEVIRGQEALSRLKSASASNPAPPAGMEYVLARVKFELKGRYVSDTMGMNIGDNPLQWVALRSDLTELAKPAVTAPSPALVGRVDPGKSIEGWVAFTVDTSDAKPIMVFDPDTGGATGRGKTEFFRLYK